MLDVESQRRRVGELLREASASIRSAVGDDLRGADLGASDLLGTDLRGALVSGADPRESLFSTSPQVAAAHGDGETKLPGSIRRPQHWPARLCRRARDAPR